MSQRQQALTTSRETSLVEIVDRALGAGVVITGDITLSLADVELVYLNLRVLVSSVDTLREDPAPDAGSGGFRLDSGDPAQ